ncbi:MAG: type II secretion system protein [Trueperaceae bacterium]|nr:type II secretion system protein [Trueperaceae bacterium]
MKVSRHAGFSLIELLIAVAVFSVVMLALSGILVNGLQLRRSNSNEIQALAYANTVLERYKSHWVESSNYSAGTLVNAAYLPSLPSGFSQQGPTFDCLDELGNVIETATCVTMVPPLRRISLVVKDADGEILANLVTEIGNPAP